MSDVKVIPISPKYRENYDHVFPRKVHCKDCYCNLTLTNQEIRNLGRRNQGTRLAAIIGDESRIPEIYIQEGQG